MNRQTEQTPTERGWRPGNIPCRIMNVKNDGTIQVVPTSTVLVSYVAGERPMPSVDRSSSVFSYRDLDACEEHDGDPDADASELDRIINCS